MKILSNWTVVFFIIWYKLFKNKEFERNVRILRWVKYDIEFVLVGLDGRFKYWINLGIILYCIVFFIDGLDIFKEFMDIYYLGKEDFFRYF